jgi:hypothetical protein
VIVLSTGAALLTTTATPKALGGALAVLGAAGISLSGTAAKMRNAANNLLAQLRDEFYEAAVSEATCLAPELPSERPADDAGQPSTTTPPGASEGGRLGGPASVPGRALPDTAGETGTQPGAPAGRPQDDIAPATVTGGHPVVPPLPAPGATPPPPPPAGATGAGPAGANRDEGGATAAGPLAQPGPPPPAQAGVE